MRADHVESLHRGIFAIASPSGDIEISGGDARQLTFMRSSAKPFQAMALILTGAADALHLSDADLAIACSSHNGQSEHVEAVTGLLDRAGVDSSALRCGVHPPLYPPAAQQLIANGEQPSALHNNCSGKHSAMLATCKVMGWPLDSYLDPSHPLQQLNLSIISTFTDIPLQQIEIGVDGCGVPVFYIPVAAVAVAFARLASGECIPPEFADAAARIRSAMMAHPFLVAGTDRFDTDLMDAAGGQVVCKGGAQGGEGIGLIEKRVGIGMKISDGNASPISLVTLKLLEHLGLLKSLRPEMSKYERVTLRNHAGTEVGSLEAVFEFGSFPS